MAGTHEGGLRAAETNKRMYGADFYSVIGRYGGVTSRGGGFASTKPGKDGLLGPERARLAGEKGGRASRKPRKRV